MCVFVRARMHARVRVCVGLACQVRQEYEGFVLRQDSLSRISYKVVSCCHKYLSNVFMNINSKMTIFHTHISKN